MSDIGIAAKVNIATVFKKREMGILLGLIILFMVFAIIAPETFLKQQNILNVIRQVSLIGILSVGMTFIIVCGDIDLSVGSTYCLAATVCAILMTTGTPVWISVIIAILIGIGIGIANGVIIAYLRIPSFIATLGMMNIAKGSALTLSGGFVIVVAKSHVSDPALEQFLFMGGGKVFGFLPSMSLIFIAVAIIGYLVFHKTILGFLFRAVGGNRNAAQVAGINVRKVRLTSFAITGGLAGFGGVIALAFLNNAQGSVGQGLELDVIAATFIGGASAQGGEGSVLGTMIGVLIMGFLRNGLILVGVSTFVQMILIGFVIIGSVAIDMWTSKRHA